MRHAFQMKMMQDDNKKSKKCGHVKVKEESSPDLQTEMLSRLEIMKITNKLNVASEVNMLMEGLRSSVCISESLWYDRHTILWILDDSVLKWSTCKK